MARFLAVLVLALPLTGCRTARVKQGTGVFRCTVEQYVPRYDPPPPGRLSISCKNDSEPIGDRSCKILAESIPIAQFVVALAEALELSVRTTSYESETFITFAEQEASVGHILAWLESRSRLEFDLVEGRIDVTYRNTGTLEPLRLRLVTLPPQVEPREVAELYCQVVGSPRGKANTTGSEVLLTDIIEGLERAEKLIKALCKLRGGDCSELKWEPRPNPEFP